MKTTGFLLLVALLLAGTSGCATPEADAQQPSVSPLAEESSDKMEAHAPKRDNTLPRTSPNAMVGQTIGVTKVKVHYGRPSVKGRQVFGDLEPYGETWRTGANEATTITFSDDVMIEGQALAAGTYALFTIPTEGDWTIIFNNEAEQWGDYEYDEGADALRVTVTPEEAPNQEMLTIGFDEVTTNSAEAWLRWSTVMVPFTIETNTEENVLAQAREMVAEADSWQTPYQYARYALQNEVGEEEALGWIEQSIEMESNFANLSTKAYLLAATGDAAGAVETGNIAVSMTEGSDTKPRGLEQFQKDLANWKAGM